MKVVVFLAALLLSLNVFASQNEPAEGFQLVKYKENSELPAELQSLVNDVVIERCEFVVKKGWDVTEASTTTEVASDTIVTDIDYKTALKVVSPDPDGTEPDSVFFINVVSSILNVGQKNQTGVVISIDGGSYCRPL